MPRKVNKQITVIIGMVVNDGKILMVRRHEPEVPDAHLKWEFPGGKVDFGETPEEAVTRELLEETGVEVKAIRLLPYVHTTNWNYPWGIQQTLIFGYECKFINQFARVDDHHVNSIKWVSLNEVSHLESLPGDKEFLEALRSS